MSVDSWGRELACLNCGARLKPHPHAGRPRTCCSPECRASHAALLKRNARCVARAAKNSAEYSPRCSACGESLSVPHRRLCPTLEVRA